MGGILCRSIIPALLAGFVEGGPLSPQEGPAQEPPGITYGNSRSSSTWIKTPSGVDVAVDKGITWQGVQVYLSLTGELVAVDAQTRKTLWCEEVGAFWRTITFKEVEIKAGQRGWAVELRPLQGAGEVQAPPQYHDLKTGKILKLPGADKQPSGTPFDPRKVWSGPRSCIGKAFSVVVSSEENWKLLKGRMFSGLREGKAPEFDAIDFIKERILVVSDGESHNCEGIGIESATEDDKRILIRLRHGWYQTFGGGNRVRPFGIFVIPRRDEKSIVVEKNTQHYIGGPPLWKEVMRLDRPGPADKEMDGLPPASPQE